MRRTLKADGISATLNSSGGVTGVNLTFQATGDPYGSVILNNQCTRTLVLADEMYVLFNDTNGDC